MNMLTKVYKPLNSMRGDTIVEVLFALAVLGAVLGSSYVVVSRNVLTNRSSQERLEAVKLAESQFEKLKIKAANDAGVFALSNFCLTGANTVAQNADANTACRVDAAGAPTTTDPRYRLAIINDANVGSGATTGVRYKITVTWSNVRGTGDDTLDYYYEVYR